MKQKGKIFKRCLSIVLCMTMLLFSGNRMSVYAQETESNARMEGETVTENVETVPEVENNDEDFISATTFSEGGVLRAAPPAEARNAVVTLPDAGGKTLQDLVNAAPDNTPTTIELTANYQLPKPLVIPAGKDITIQSSEGNQYQLSPTRGMEVTFKNLISVEEGGRLTVQNTKLFSSGSSPMMGPVLLVKGMTFLGSQTVVTTDKAPAKSSSAIVVDAPNALLTIAGAQISNFSLQSGHNGGAVIVKQGTLMMNDGTIEKCIADNGGAIAIEQQGKVIMRGGQILNCKTAVGGFGGGVFLAEQGAQFEMSGGEISGCNAWWSGGGVSTEQKGGDVLISGGRIGKNTAIQGGGVYVYAPGTFKMSGGLIDSNEATVSGAGVYLAGSEGKMTGGTISNNTAKSGGGGIGVYPSWPSFKSVLTITGGTIKNNTAHGEGLDGVLTYSGGGIYVDQGCTLYIYNVAIADNKAVSIPKYASKGGGLAACPTSHVEIHRKDGAVFYQNKDQSGYADEIYLAERGGNQDTPYISPYYLGGGKYDWADANGGKIEAYDAVAARVDNPQQDIALFNALKEEDPGVQDALEEAKVFITDNNGLFGGGIGTNGTVIIGTEEDEPATGNLTVSKIVSGDGADHNKLFSFSVTAAYEPFKAINGTYGDMTFVDGTATFTLKDQQSKTAEGLPVGTVYTVIENDADDYDITMTNDQGTIQQDTLSVATFTNHRDKPVCPCEGGEETDPQDNPPVKDTGNLTVVKTIVGADLDLNREFTFTVTLDQTNINGQYGDMFFSDGTATFTLKHGQSKTASGLPDGVAYTVKESGDSGYIADASNATGSILKGTTETALFQNRKVTPGTSEPNPPKPEESASTPKPSKQVTSQSKKTSTTKSEKAPSTGDNFNVGLWMGLAGSSFAVLVSVMLKKEHFKNCDR